MFARASIPSKISISFDSRVKLHDSWNTKRISLVTSLQKKINAGHMNQKTADMVYHSWVKTTVIDLQTKQPK